VETTVVIVVDPASGFAPGLGERVELLALDELAASANVELLDEAVLPRSAWVGVEGNDAAQGGAVSH
jgi:hypothetical protein